MSLRLVSATRLKLAPILACLALAGCLSVTEPESTPAPALDTGLAEQADPVPNDDGVIEVQITLTEFAIESSLDRFETGVPYRFLLENKGALAHDFRVTRRGEAEMMMSMHTDGHSHEHGTELLLIHEPDLQPGAVYTTEMTFQQPGDFEFGCHVAGHLESGMLVPITVVGEVVALPTPINPDSIVYDAEAMAGMPCHGMGLTIMGDCTEEDVARIKAEILAKDAEAAAAAASMGSGMDSSMPMDMGSEDDHEHADDGDHGHDEDAAGAADDAATEVPAGQDG
jgi:uncharacterized cupredoxin-like copper-binding protein